MSRPLGLVLIDLCFSVTPLSVVFGSVYSLQQLSLSLLNVTLGQGTSTVEMDQMDRGG